MPGFSPDGELLFLAWPRKSNQKESHPSSLPFGFPSRDEQTGAPPTRPGGSHRTRPTAELEHGSALFPSVHLDSATQQGETGSQSTGSQIFYCSKKESVVSPSGPLLGRREAQPHGEKRRRVSELRSEPRCVRLARASCGVAPGGEHRREAVGRHSRGRLSLVTFFGEAKKVTRPKAKSTHWSGSQNLN